MTENIGINEFVDDRIKPSLETPLFANKDGGEVYGWILGKLNEEGKVSTLLFGQFTTQITPPENGWVYLGYNINSNAIVSYVSTFKGLFLVLLFYNYF